MIDSFRTSLANKCENRVYVKTEYIWKQSICGNRVYVETEYVYTYYSVVGRNRA